jgi:hypothetical protein
MDAALSAIVIALVEIARFLFRDLKLWTITFPP